MVFGLSLFKVGVCLVTKRGEDVSQILHAEYRVESDKGQVLAKVICAVRHHIGNLCSGTICLLIFKHLFCFLFH